MKNRFILALMALLFLSLSMSAENTYLEKDYHYTVRTGGNGVLHFCIPIWVYGTWNDYYLNCSDGANDNNDSYIWYSVGTKDPGRGHVTRIMSFKAERKGSNDKDSPIGEGYLLVHSGEGIVVLKSGYDGVDKQFNADGNWSGKLQLKRKNDDDHKRITYLEFDWYPPESLDGQTFYVGANANIYRKYTGEPCSDCGGTDGHIHWIPMDGEYKGRESLQTPELFQPYLYAADAAGTTGYGQAAIPFVAYQEPISYTTSLNPTAQPCLSQAGTMYLPTTDEVQQNYYATFTVYRDKDHSDQATLKTNYVDIPAYHRLYDLKAEELRDDQNSMLGQNRITWNIHTPQAEELIPSDFFEIQRALKPDYSDATSLTLQPYAKDSSVYEYVDDVSGLRDASNKNRWTAFSKNYDFYNDEGRLATFKATVSSDIVEHGMTVYYRVRRASAAIWGWENHPFVQSVSVEKNAWLAPLAKEQAPYTKDANFDDNRIVHFNFKIDNAVTKQDPTPADKCTYDIQIDDLSLKMPVNLSLWGEWEYASQTLTYNYKEQGASSYTYDTPREVGTTDNENYHFTVPLYSMLYVHITDAMGNEASKEIYVDGLVIGNLWRMMVGAGFYEVSAAIGTHPERVDSLRQVIVDQFMKDSLAKVKDDLYANLLPMMKSDDQDPYARCNWDKNAQLVITKRMTDYGTEQEIRVPNDSIKRQADGSWMAHMTDVADMPCTHYQYSVRIDDSRSILNFKDKSSLDPIVLTGDDLFSTQVANINTLQATQGTDKQGVIITWEPTSGSLSDYMLLRRETTSNGDYDTLTITNEAGFRDAQALPNTHYEYKLVVRYICNNNSSSRDASVEGWRSPYGSIRGRVVFEDGSGCAGVTVKVEADGKEVKTLVTDADGGYFADSLLYDPLGTDYKITPTSEHGVFIHNDIASEHSAIVNISLERTEVKNVEFLNTSSVRLTGRVLYEHTTIPVYGANFKINGKLVSYAGSPVSTAHDGTFQLVMPQAPATLQVVMEGHTFVNDGFLYINGKDTFSLDKPQDGVRFWDQTTVKLAGRVVGGNDQAKKPLGFGLSKNNLGDDLKIVMELEGDNISYMVNYPNDLTITERDTSFAHLVKTAESIDTVGNTSATIMQKRIIIHPDQETGEYEIDLWPVRYKVTQITAKGYSTLYGAGQGAATVDLTNAVVANPEVINGKDTTYYQATFNRIYHSPIELQLTQLNFGIDCDYFGESQLKVSSVVNKETTPISVVCRDADSTAYYLFGHPIYKEGQYSYRAEAFEQYFYNNDPLAGARDQVNMHGGTLRIHNGLYSNDQTILRQLDTLGRATFELNVGAPNFRVSGEAAMRTVSVSAEIENEFIEAEPIQAFITGNRTEQHTIRHDTVGFAILDVLRDPPGENSYAWIEEGTTYSYSQAVDFDINVGVEIGIGWGANVSNTIGAWGGVGGGTFAGMDYVVSKQIMMEIPLSFEYKGNDAYTYSFTTTDRIQTSSDNLIVGSDADIFLGVAQGLLTGQARAIRVIDEDTYKERKPAVDAGTLVVLASGQANGKNYYLVIGTEIVYKGTIDDAFAYTQEHIVNTIIPDLKRERNSLILMGTKDEVQKLANSTDSVLYWNKATDMSKFGEEDQYEVISPANSSKNGTNRVKMLNYRIKQWKDALVENEKQKINARKEENRVGTWSVSGGVTRSHSDNFAYGNTYTWRFTGLDVSAASTNVLGAISNDVMELLDAFEDVMGEELAPWTVDGHAPGSKFKVTLKPILDVAVHIPYSKGKSTNKSTGFTLAPNKFGSLTVSVYTEKDTIFEKVSKKYRDKMYDADSMRVYGSYIFFTEGGASMCPYEGPEKPRFYDNDTELNHGTLKLEDPHMQIDTHERSDIPADKPAIFNLQLSNEGQVENGLGAIGTTLILTQTAGSNPKGAKIYIDGMPVTGNGMEFFLASGQSVSKVMEVYRGEADDYENIELRFGSSTCASNADYLTFSVHYVPSSSDVEISVPHDKWIMNTFAAQDSVGYYLPVTIEGFDVNHRGFDHIEFQYKLTTQSDDAWVNQCSFFADKDLYDAATGNKQMITNGRINTLRFYGERDPMEQQYDLRAVTFCRHGSGFVTKSSKVLTGIKDTRPPRVFGYAEPANSILGVGDNLKLRFNEPIAGNYLDEDNNFQLVGTTNSTGITSSTSVHFDGSPQSYAQTKASRSLAGKSFTIDVLVKPSVANADEVFFTHGEQGKGLVFGKTKDNRLYVQMGAAAAQYSKQLEDPMIAFTRVIVTYDNNTSKVRFYAGTLDVTAVDSAPKESVQYNVNAPLCFGKGFNGNMLEARVWTKALTTEQIANTHLVRLTGYEQKLAAYYPMNEGRGATLTDKANGATLFLEGVNWIVPEGISLAFDGSQPVVLDQDLLSRSEELDYTLMLWFKTLSTDATIFSAGRLTDTTAAKGTWIGLKNGELLFRNNAKELSLSTGCADDAWHHFVLSVNRTANTVALFIDGQLRNHIAASEIGSLSGKMYLGSDGFKGNIDEFVLYEQALPKALIEEADNISQRGDEMGLIAYLPFEMQKENVSGIYETVFTMNNRRVFKDLNGNVVNKIQPLVLEPADVEKMADKTNDAPVRDKSALSKLNFDWAFNQDELLINLNMLDREINKQTVYVTVRNVEDLNGNRMVSPVMWQAFVDRNSLKWSENEIKLQATYGEKNAYNRIYSIKIINQSGTRHQYTIDALPDWLSVDAEFGSIQPMEEKTIQFTYNVEMPVGVFSDLIYLTDENGLAEPLRVELTIEAVPPYDEVDKHKYPLNMSLCGEVKLVKDEKEIYDNDPDDIIYALFGNECVGMANVTIISQTGVSEVFLTIHGSDDMNHQPIRFQLWQASTGKLFDLTPDRKVTFAHGLVLGCGDEKSVLFTTGGSQTQNIQLEPGWNWVSTNLNLSASKGDLATCMTADSLWTEGDEIKNPASRQFSSYHRDSSCFMGELNNLHFSQMYMIYTKQGNTIRISGEALPQDSMKITFRGDGQWNVLPCLLDEPMSLSEALSGYYDMATAGDLIKAQDRFATFSKEGKWVGDLASMRPGEGYFFRRVGAGTVDVPFYNKNGKATIPQQLRLFRNPKAATNMTMIAKVEGEGLKAFINDELVGEATPIDSLYFLTIQSDNIGELRFTTSDGQSLIPVTENHAPLTLIYDSDAHVGSLRAPVLLKQGDNRPYKIIENNHVIIIRNNERYDVTGKKL